MSTLTVGGSRGSTRDPQAASRPRGRGPVAVRRRNQAVVAWIFALPFAAIFIIFMFLPLVSSFVMSFTDLTIKDIRTPFNVDFVGADQFAALFADETFRKAMANTAYFVLVGLPVTMFVALILAVLLNSGITRFTTFFRVGFYTPVVTSIVAVAVVWRFLLQKDGLVNTLLGWIGITGPDWLNSVTWSMPALIVMAVWRNIGTLMVIFLAGLQAIPQEVQEAAEVDGAGALQRFFRITIPLMRPTLLLGAVLTTVGYLQFFEEPFVMTGGGPLDSTLSISYFTYNQFGYGKFAYGSAAAYVLFAAIAVLSAVQFRLLRSKTD